AVGVDQIDQSVANLSQCRIRALHSIGIGFARDRDGGGIGRFYTPIDRDDSSRGAAAVEDQAWARLRARAGEKPRIGGSNDDTGGIRDGDAAVLVHGSYVNARASGVAERVRNLSADLSRRCVDQRGGIAIHEYLSA